VERVGASGLRIVWADGHESLYAWRDLRALCPCAACREAESAPGLPMGVPSDIQPASIEPVGNYGINIRFSDGHTTGIFSFDFLRRHCRCEACLPTQSTEG